MIDYNLTTDFKASEFACRHCGRSGIKQWFVEHLQSLRDYHGRPMVITSGYRCELHPIERDKSKPGRHYEGIAADIKIVGVPLVTVWRSLANFPQFTGIGVNRYAGFIHLDSRPLRPTGARVVWAYTKDGQQVRWSGKWEELP
jgi:zinc D-Ala-D-Ala carboxypeptidase